MTDPILVNLRSKKTIQHHVLFYDKRACSHLQFNYTTLTHSHHSKIIKGQAHIYNSIMSQSQTSELN